MQALSAQVRGEQAKRRDRVLQGRTLANGLQLSRAFWGRAAHFRTQRLRDYIFHALQPKVRVLPESSYQSFRRRERGKHKRIGRYDAEFAKSRLS